MLEFDYHATGWVRVFVKSSTETGFAVLAIQPMDKNTRALGQVAHLPLRPGRMAQRVLFVPSGCVSLHVCWLKADADLPSLKEDELALTHIASWKAGWLMKRRITHLHPRSSLNLLDLLLPSRLYPRYEATLAYQPLSALQPLPFPQVDVGDSTLLVCLHIEDIQTQQSWSAEQWVVLLQPKDAWVVHGHAQLQRWSEAYPDKRVILFDEQRQCETTGQVEPWLKPGWNPDLFLSSSYTGHGVAFRGDLFTDLLQYLNSSALLSVDTCVDALLLSLLVNYPDKCDAWVGHCPEILLQVLLPADDEPENVIMQQNRQRFLQETQSTLDKVTKGVLPRSWRLPFPLPDCRPLVSLCVPTRNGLAVLKPCVEALLSKTRYKNFELLVIDNQSDCTATLEYLAELQIRDTRVRVLRYDQPFNFSAINNYAVAHARGDVVGLINNDIEPRHPEWLIEMVAHAVRPDVGCVGAKLYYPNGRIQHAGVVLGIGGVAGHAFRFEPGDATGYQGRLALAQNYSAVTAACLLVRKSLYLEVGGLDERLAVNYNDVDFCLKVKALGYRNVWTPHAELTHHESYTRGGPVSRKNRKRAEREFRLMRERWGELLDNDPAYHPKLTRVHEDFSLGANEWN